MPRARNPLPQLLPQRVTMVKQRVDASTWRRRTPLAVLAGPLNAGFASLGEANEQTFEPIASGSIFCKPPTGQPEATKHHAPTNQWCNRWFRIDLPAAAKGEAGLRHLVWACDGETTVYWKGEPWAGLDAGHASCPVPDQAGTLWLDCGCYATGIWVPGRRVIGPDGLRFDSASLAVRDQAAWSASCDLDVLLDLLVVSLDKAGIKWSGSAGFSQPHEFCPPLVRILTSGLEEACDGFIAGGIPAMQPRLDALKDRLKGGSAWLPVSALAGHAHIDLVWLWPESATERKGVHTFATVLRLMERYSEFRFSQSQPSLYRAIERQAPGQAKAIRSAIRRGQWEVMGGFEVEPDVHLPSGEALARSLAIGQAKTQDLRGSISTLCWIPDVFGYSACLPQILRLGGVTSFYTTKMTWSTVTRFPYNSFVWRGHDGSEVLTHLCTVGYNGTVTAKELINAMEGHRQAGEHGEMLTCHGYGDGGGGPNELMCERARRLADLAGVPPARWTTAEAVFARMESVRERLPIYQGELYLEYHRGTYTSQSDLKAAYRGAERALQTHEAVRVVQGTGPLDEIDWQRVAFAQFHDALPGSSIAAVYAQLTPELNGIGERHLAASRAALTGAGPGWTVFNPLPYPRTVVVELPVGAGSLVEEDGSAVPMQFSEAVPGTVAGEPVEARSLALVSLGGLGVTSLIPAAPRADEVELSTVRVANDLLDNGVISAGFSADGQLDALRIDGQPLRLAGLCGLRLYDDRPLSFDAWDIDHYSLSHPRPVAGVPLAIAEGGPVRAVLAGEGPLGERSRVALRWILDAGSRWLRCELAIDWQENHQLLKFHVPTGYRGRWARFGCPFGSILRPQLPGVQADEAQWEVPGSRWAAVIDEDGDGLGLVSESKYGFSCRDGDLGLSLLRAPADPDPGCDRGRHVIRFAIGRHQSSSAIIDGGSNDLWSTALAADALFTPPVVAPGKRRRHRGDDLGHGPFTLRNLGSLVPAWTVPDKRGYTVRLHETAGGSGSATLQLEHEAKSVELVDFLGNVLGDPVHLGGGAVRIDYRPYQILSVRVRR
ncbi:hypothetical protein LBMAG53_35690 [Planctomycetota bacterium]|nr:hypothetical protein LBMAG53_35690 [Planctomycetota bacterium]